MKNELPASHFDRRTFLRGMSALAGAAALTGTETLAALNPDAGKNEAGIPMRVLGRTGAKITIFGLGSAPIGQSKPGAAVGVPVYRAALEAGVNYVDTAHIYDQAEAYLGEVVPKFRDKIFLTTKSIPHSNDPQEGAEQMQQQFEESLRKLKTDHVDLLHVHSIGDKDPQMIMAKGGPLEFVHKMKEQGKTRFIGITGHNHVPRFADIINTGLVDVIMVPLNFVDYHQYKFEDTILPAARKHGCGILAMKVFGGHHTMQYGHPGPSRMPAELLQTAMRYSLGIEGVAATVLGVYTADEVKQNVAWAKSYTPMSDQEIAETRVKGKSMVAQWGPRFGPVA